MTGTLMSNSSQQIIAAIANMNIVYVLPQIIIICGGMTTMITSVFPQNRFRQGLNYTLAVFFTALAAVVSAYMVFLPAGKAFDSMIDSDIFSQMLNFIYSASSLLVILIAHTYFKRRGRYIYELYPLIMFAVSGMMFMTSGSDLIIIFLGLEILSVALYVLTGIDTGDRRSNESSVKYFIMGAFASAFLLYGIAMLYGATGTTSLEGISLFIIDRSAWSSIYMAAGIVLIITGFGFKISMVPFHMWTPDVYQGTPLIITLFLSTAPKAAALTALIKAVIIIAPPSAPGGWLPGLIAFLALLTMTAGNLLALNQTDIKRMMAYSSIAHIGYMLVAFAVFRGEAVSSVLFYFAAYILMNTGIFAILSMAASDEDRNLTLEGIQGLARKKPLLGIFLVIFLFSLAGIPPTAGFSAKFFIFSEAVKSGMYLLAVAGVLNSAVSAYYYLRILLHAYVKEPEESAGLMPGVSAGSASLIVMFSAALGTVLLGILPGYMIELARQAVLFL